MNGGLFFLLFGFLIFGSVYPIMGWRPFRIEYLNLTAYSLDDNVAINTTLNKNDGISIYLNLKKNLLRPFAKTEFYMDSGDGLFDMKIINDTIDICRLFRDKRYFPFIQLIYKMYTDKSNFPTSCPIKRNLYVGKSLKMDVEKLPPTLPNKQMYIAATFLSQEGLKQKPIAFYKCVVGTKNIVH